MPLIKFIRLSNRWRVSRHIIYNFQIKGEVVTHECCSNNNFILSIIKMSMKKTVVVSFFFLTFLLGKNDSRFYLFIITLYNLKEKKWALFKSNNAFFFSYVTLAWARVALIHRRELTKKKKWMNENFY